MDQNRSGGPPWAWLPPVFVAALAGCMLAIGACGSGASSSSSVWAHATVLSERDPTDRDDDRPGAGRSDPDTDQSMTWGRIATAAEAHAMLGLIRRYYAYAAAKNVVGACALIYAPRLESLSEEGATGGSRVARCRLVMSAPFAAHHAELASDLTSQALIEAKIHERRAIARVLFAGRRDRLVELRGQGSSWQMYDVLNGGSP